MHLIKPIPLGNVVIVGASIVWEYQHCPASFTVTGEIHYTFFEQLMRQISPQIYRAAGRVLSESFDLGCVDRFFVREQDCLYLYVGLGASNFHEVFYGSLWVKCLANFHSLNLAEEHPLRFELCDEEETKWDNVIRFTYDHSDYWGKNQSLF